MTRALTLIFNPLKNDARVQRQISFLKEKFSSVTVIGIGPYCPEGVEYIEQNHKLSFARKALAGMALLLKRYGWAYNLLYRPQQLPALPPFDLIVANDIDTLPLAFLLKTKEKIIFDAHEYAPRHFEDKWRWRLFFQGFNTYFCKKYIPQVDGMTTVSEGFAKAYYDNFGVQPVIITSAPAFCQSTPCPVDKNRIRLVHQGIVSKSRKLELIIDMMRHLDERYHLDFILLPPSRGNTPYFERIKALAADNPRIRFLPTLSPQELVPFINQYDIGVLLMHPNFNVAHTLPNKFFECIQARIAIAIGPIPEMAKITNDYRIGIVSETFSGESLAQAILRHTAEEIFDFKKNTEAAAREFNSEHNREKFFTLIDMLL